MTAKIITKEDRIQAEAGLKVLCSVQLLYENIMLLDKSKMKAKTKARLSKIKFDSGELNKEFWSNLSESEEAAFQDKLRRIEQIIEE